MIMAKTTDIDRLDYLRLFLGCLEANIAIGRNIRQVADELRDVIAKREKDLAQ